jgi:hypothetical protein
MKTVALTDLAAKRPAIPAVVLSAAYLFFVTRCYASALPNIARATRVEPATELCDGFVAEPRSAALLAGRLSE